MRLPATAFLLGLVALVGMSAPAPHAHASATASVFDDDCPLARLAVPPPGVVAAAPPGPTLGSPVDMSRSWLADRPADGARPVFASRAPPSSP